MPPPEPDSPTPCLSLQRLPPASSIQEGITSRSAGSKPASQAGSMDFTPRRTPIRPPPPGTDSASPPTIRRARPWRGYRPCTAGSVRPGDRLHAGGGLPPASGTAQSCTPITATHRHSRPLKRVRHAPDGVRVRRRVSAKAGGPHADSRETLNRQVTRLVSSSPGAYRSGRRRRYRRRGGAWP